MNDRKRDEQQLAFWTALPVRFGLPMLVAVFIIANIVMMQRFLFDGKPFEWSAIVMLVGVMVAAACVHNITKRLKEKLSKK